MGNAAIDLSKEYGVVLEGGGARGAYQIGVWKALIEHGVKIKGVAGVSVGALNGALMCMGDYNKAVDIWKNISYSKIMRVDDAQMDKLMNGKFKELSLQAVGKDSKNIFVQGGLDVTPLKRLIEDMIDENKIKESEIEFIMGTFNVNELKEMDIAAHEAEEGKLKDYLMASASFPLFKNDKLHGKTYLDGGLVNNVPIDLLINRGYKNIIVVRIYGIGIEKKVKIPEDVNVIYIAPRYHLCNILEFNKEKAARNISLGYYDAQRLFHDLAGRVYYIEKEQKELDYFQSLLKTEEETIYNLIVHHKLEGKKEASVRTLVEDILPMISNKLKLGKEWSYGDLYFALLEYSARRMRIPRLKIYTETDFQKIIKERMIQRKNDGGNFDSYMDLCLSVVESY